MLSLRLSLVLERAHRNSRRWSQKPSKRVLHPSEPTLRDTGRTKGTCAPLPQRVRAGLGRSPSARWSKSKLRLAWIELLSRVRWQVAMACRQEGPSLRVTQSMGGTGTRDEVSVGRLLGWMPYPHAIRVHVVYALSGLGCQVLSLVSMAFARTPAWC